MSQSKLTRRAMMAGAAATVPVGMASGASAQSSDLLLLIEEHKAAWDALGDAIDQKEEREEAFRAAYRTTGYMVAPSIDGPMECFCDQEVGREYLRNVYDKERARLAWLDRIENGLADRAIAALDRKQAEDFRKFEERAAEVDARKEEFGLAAAERNLDAAHEAERNAACAVLAHPCATMEEGRIKAEYIRTASSFTDSAFDDRQIEALLQSIGGAS